MKKILALILALAMCLSLVACGGGDSTPTTEPSGGGNDTPDTPTTEPSSELAGTYDVKIWVAENAVSLTTQQIADYNATNTDGIVINATIEAVGEGEAASSMVQDVEAGADIFCFAQDQLGTLIQAGALAQLGVSAADLVKTSNDGSSVASVTSGDALYAYPLTSDNGYFMYYDKSVITDDVDITDLASIVAACEKAGRYFSFELEGSAWYNASFFFATGCVSFWNTDSDGNFLSVTDTWNSDAGVISAKGMQILIQSDYYLNSSKTTDFAAATPSAVVVSGTWDYGTALDILGENLGAAELPSFTVDGQTYHLSSFSGCKLMGVKPQTDSVKQAVLHKLAQYLTSEKCQLERFNEPSLQWGPSNLAAQSSDAVQAAPHLAALAAQNNYATPQGTIHSSWWDIAKVVSTGVKEATNDADIKATLQTYADSMAALFTMSDAELSAFTVIGSICGTSWNTDFAMTEQADGTWKSDALELHAGETFKCRQGKAWDVCYGDPVNGDNDGNYIVPADGTYYIILDATTGTVTLEAAG